MKGTEYIVPARSTVLVYGPVGVGKSVLASSVSLLGRTLYLDLQRGIKSAISRGDGVWCKFANLEIENISSSTEFAKHVKRAQADGFRFLVVDTISDLEQIIEAEYMQGARQMSYQDSRERDQRMLEIAKFFRDNDLCVIVTAYETISKDGAQITPLVDQRIAQALPGQIDVVGYLAVKEDGNGGLYRQLLLGGAKILGRDRNNRLALVEPITDRPHLLWEKLFATTLAPTRSATTLPPPPKRIS